MPPRPRGQGSSPAAEKRTDPGRPKLPPPTLGKGLSGAAPPLLPCATLLLAPRGRQVGREAGAGVCRGQGFWWALESGTVRAQEGPLFIQGSPGSWQRPLLPRQAGGGSAHRCPELWAQRWGRLLRLLQAGGVAAGKSDAWLVPEPFLRFSLECKAAR